MGFNSGNVTAELISSAATATPVTLLNGSRSTIGTTTLGTVGVGKIWRIIYAQVSSVAGSTATNVSVQANSLKVVDIDIHSNNNESNACAVCFTYETAPVITAGQTVTLVTDQNSNCSAVVGYYEENA